MRLIVSVSRMSNEVYVPVCFSRNSNMAVVN